MTILNRSKYLVIEGEVYCLTHTCTHEDSLDPYGEGQPTCYGREYGVTKDQVHRPIYYRARIGDIDETPMVTCPLCGGSGEVYSKRRDENNIPHDAWRCPACAGTGEVTAEQEQALSVEEDPDEALLVSLTRLYGEAGARRILDSEPPF